MCRSLHADIFISICFLFRSIPSQVMIRRVSQVRPQVAGLVQVARWQRFLPWNSICQPQPSHSPAGPVSWQITEMSFQNVINVTAQKGSKVAHLGSNQMISKMLNIVNTFCVGFPSNIFSIFCWKKIKYANCIFSQNKIAVASGDAELIHEY